jgi:hypothetical protein
VTWAAAPSGWSWRAAASLASVAGFPLVTNGRHLVELDSSPPAGRAGSLRGRRRRRAEDALQGPCDLLVAVIGGVLVDERGGRRRMAHPAHQLLGGGAGRRGQGGTGVA